MKNKEKKKRNIWKSIVIIIVIAVAIGGVVKHCDKLEKESYDKGYEIGEKEGYDKGYLDGQATLVAPNNTEIIEERLSVSAKLQTADYICTCVDNYEDKVNLKEDLNIPVNLNLPGTKKSFIVSYSGTVSAGIEDLSKATVKENKNGSITITLPQVVIFDTVVDNDSITIHDEHNNFLNQLSITDYNDATIRIKSEIKEKAIDNGVLKLAKTNAETLIRNMFGDLDSDIKIKWAE